MINLPISWPEAQRGDSIFKAGNVIKAEEIVPEQVTYTQLALDLEPGKALDEVYQKTGIEKDASTDALLKKSKDKIQEGRDRSDSV